MIAIKKAFNFLKVEFLLQQGSTRHNIDIYRFQGTFICSPCVAGSFSFMTLFCLFTVLDCNNKGLSCSVDGVFTVAAPSVNPSHSLSQCLCSIPGVTTNSGNKMAQSLHEPFLLPHQPSRKGGSPLPWATRHISELAAARILERQQLY